MIPYLAEGVTIAAITTILVVYLVTLRRNGWLGGTSGDLYLCPNQQCKRVFQNPVEMKDLSETPVRVYPACPHCGKDLGPLLNSLAEKPRVHKPTLRLPGQQVQTRVPSPLTKIQQSKGLPHVDKPQQIARKSIESLKPTTEALKHAAAVPQVPKTHPEPRTEPEVAAKQPPSEKPTSTVAKTASVDPRVHTPRDAQSACAHFFGYLHTLEKASLIPNTCYSCGKIMDCYCKEADSVVTA